jgi:hypothetical protein
MSKLLSKEQIHSYITSAPRCPWCKSKELKSNNLSMHSDMVLRCLVTCNTCNQAWNEVYKMISIEDVIQLRLYTEDEDTDKELHNVVL